MRRVFEIIGQNYLNKISSQLLQTIEETEIWRLRKWLWADFAHKTVRIDILVYNINYLKVLVTWKCSTGLSLHRHIVAHQYHLDLISEYCAPLIIQNFNRILLESLNIRRWGNSTSLLNDPNIYHTRNLRDIWNPRTLARGFFMKNIAWILKISGSDRIKSWSVFDTLLHRIFWWSLHSQNFIKLVENLSWK